jgi:acyl dehydratase
MTASTTDTAPTAEPAGDPVITQDDIDTLKASTGVEHPIVPHFERISQDAFRHYAVYNVAHRNPLWTDPEYAAKSRFGTTVAAPTTEYLASSTDLAMGGFGLHKAGIASLHAFDEWTFHRPIRPNEAIRASFKQTDVTMRESRWTGGKILHQSIETTYRDEQGETVSAWTMGLVRAPSAGSRNEQVEKSERYRYTDEELARIDADFDREEMRGATPRPVDGVKVGDELGVVVKGPLTVMDIICWWMGSKGPFMYPFGIKREMLRETPGLGRKDPISNVTLTPEEAHWDLEQAKLLGVTNQYDIGKQRTTAAVHLITNWMGDDGDLLHLKVVFKRPNLVGDTTWYTGTVRTVDVGTGEVVVDLAGTNQRGVVHTTGEATLRLPLPERS